MDESRRLAMRRGHVKHKTYCSCGKIVCGNGGRASHRAMHERRGDGHHGLTQDAFLATFGQAKTITAAPGTPGLVAPALARR